MDDKIIDLLISIQTAVTNMAPGVWQALIVAARVDSILTLFFCMLVVTVTAWLINRTPIWWPMVLEHDLEPAYIAGLIIWGIVIVIAVVMFFSAPLWLGLFNPEAAVIAHLIDKFGAK